MRLSLLAESMRRYTIILRSGLVSSSMRLSARESLPRSRLYFAISVKTLVVLSLLEKV
jgi:hypothetical protein